MNEHTSIDTDEILEGKWAVAGVQVMSDSKNPRTNCSVSQSLSQVLRQLRCLQLLKCGVRPNLSGKPFDLLLCLPEASFSGCTQQRRFGKGLLNEVSKVRVRRRKVVLCLAEHLPIKLGKHE